MDEYGFDNEVIGLVDEKDAAILDAENSFLDSISAVELIVFGLLWDRISRMNQNNGFVVFDDYNISIVNQIPSLISQGINNSTYASNVNSYVSSFRDIKDLNLRAVSKVNNIPIADLELLVRPIQTQIVSQTIQGLTGAGIDSEFIQPIKNAIFANVASGARIRELEKTLRQLIVSGAIDSRLKKYVSLVARDSINQFDGQLNSLVAKTYNLNAYRYVGSLIVDSRPQCVRWKGLGVIPIFTLPQEIAWAAKYGSGLIPNTNPNNFAVYRGGYNCRHSAIPFRLSDDQLKLFKK
jgi:hypothetical protein